MISSYLPATVLHVYSHYNTTVHRGEGDKRQENTRDLMRFLLSHKTLEKFYFLNFYAFLFPLHCRYTKAYGISFNLFNLHQDEPHACGLLAAVQAEWSE